MKMPNTKSILSAIGIVAMLASPAFAKSNHQWSQQPPAQSQVSVGKYPDSISGLAHSGSESNDFEHDHGYYSPGSNS
jgi:hypothetical protein